MVLNFTLKDKYYQMYKSGNKKEEYRQVTEYWSARIPKLKKGDVVHLVRGYTNEYLTAIVEKWVMISNDMLPWYLRFLYDKDIMWYRVDFHSVEG